MGLLRTSQHISHSCPHLSACGLLLSSANFSASTQHASDHQTLGSPGEPRSLRLLPKGSLPGFCPQVLKVLLIASCLSVPSLLCHGVQFPPENCKDLVCSRLSPPHLLIALQRSGRAMQNCRAVLGVAEWWVACLLCLVKAPCSISRIKHTQECSTVVHFRALPPLGQWFFSLAVG